MSWYQSKKPTYCVYCDCKHPPGEHRYKDIVWGGLTYEESCQKEHDDFLKLVERRQKEGK